jgi:hypothetical protein
MFRNSQNLSDVLNRNYSNSEFEGFCVDLLEELSRQLKFRYKIKPITTGRYDDMVEEVKNKVKFVFFINQFEFEGKYFLLFRLLI